MMLKSSDFCADKQTNRWTKPIALPLAHVRGIIKIIYPQKSTPSKTSSYTVYEVHYKTPIVL